MKKTVLILTALLLCVGLLGCTADTDEQQKIDAFPSVQASFECTVTLVSVDPLETGEKAVFKPTINKNDITLSGALVGKKVKSVTYVDPYCVKVVLEGRATSLQYDTDYGKITVSKNALANDYDVFDLIIVEKAYVHAVNAVSLKDSGTYEATYELAAGSFTDRATKEHVRLAPGSDGTIESVALADGRLTVVITGATSCPSIEIDPEVTSFQKGFTIIVGLGARVVLE